VEEKYEGISWVLDLKSITNVALIPKNVEEALKHNK
jgi:hypothetical protein